MGPHWGCNFNDSSNNNQRFALTARWQPHRTSQGVSAPSSSVSYILGRGIRIQLEKLCLGNFLWMEGTDDYKRVRCIAGVKLECSSHKKV